jgi:tetratricopeptide (TPR) repeat protein
LPTGTSRDVVDIMETDDVISGDAQTKKSKKRQREASKREKEQLVREKENQVLSGDWKRDPQTPEEFERLLLVDGKKSTATWIKYMSYWLKMAELGKAREIAERCVKCFASTSDEQEKFNAWIAYLNMEAAFAPNMVDQLFLRAVQYCDPKKIYHAMPQVWLRVGSHTEKAQSALEKMTNKYPESRKAWLNLIEFMFNQNRFDEARAIFPKALKSLPKRKHVRVTVKVAQYEYRNGNPERGSTIFEKLISDNNSAKTDIWSVYFDEHIKANTNDLEAVRTLFERAIGMRLKPFKTKFFFKRWIDFETKYGDDTTVESVKEKAVAYVESL